MSYRAIRSMRRRGSARCICVPATTGRPRFWAAGRKRRAPRHRKHTLRDRPGRGGRSRRQDAFGPQRRNPRPQRAPARRVGIHSRCDDHSPDDAVPEVLNFSQHAVRSQTMLNFCLTADLCFVGQAPATRANPATPWLRWGCDADTIDTALRVSFCADNTAEDVDALLEGLRAGLAELQHSTSGRRLTR